MQNNKSLRSILIPLMALSIAGISHPPRQAQAAVGFAIGNLPLIIAASVVTAAGFTFVIRGARRNAWSDLRDSEGEFFFNHGVAVGLPIMLVGMILMDGPTGQRIDYTDLSPEQRASFGITDAEFESFEAEREEIAAATDTATALASQANIASVEEAMPFFEQEYAGLSPDTRSYMRKVVRAQHSDSQN